MTEIDDIKIEKALGGDLYLATTGRVYQDRNGRPTNQALVKKVAVDGVTYYIFIRLEENNG
jgi:hypothetical protein